MLPAELSGAAGAPEAPYQSFSIDRERERDLMVLDVILVFLGVVLVVLEVVLV